MYQYVGYYHPLPPYPYTSQNIVRYPYSYPYVYRAPYHPFWEGPNISGYWHTKYGSKAGVEPETPAGMYLNHHPDGKVDGYYKGATAAGWLDGMYSEDEDTFKGEWRSDNLLFPDRKGRFEFKFKPDGKSFTGKWSYREDAPRLPWNGTFVKDGQHPEFR
ncbi:hypothetical protein [Neobacillus ginsengisoli]|uniref:MORN repeat-containing protein n=1 Tax=Neobacillus ginsengisoli TaxID=904295 RepID=A0ABT9XYG7_9BACI|nr:hypothetical protein [Neobacillus ginsengisoli]MDQ0200310.1 hypothetical protein [Neobacillus ginsengisoli]